MSNNIETPAERMDRREREQARTPEQKARIMKDDEINAKWEAKKSANADKDAIEVFSFDSLKDNGAKAKARRQAEIQSLTAGLVWVDPWFSQDVPLAMDQLYLIGAKAKNGKSTFTANIAYTLWQQRKKVLIIANEESSTDALARIACIHLKLNFNADKLGKLSQFDHDRITDLIQEVSEYVHVIGKDLQKTYIFEVVEGIMEKAKSQNYATIIVDYYQNITTSLLSPGFNMYEVQAKFKTYAETFIKQSNSPLIVFAQLYPNKKESSDFKTRIEGTKSIYNAATHIFELSKDKKSGCSLLEVIESRFAGDIETFCFKFQLGKLVRISDEDYIAEEAKGKASLILNAPQLNENNHEK